MNAERRRGPVVIDTNVVGADLVPGSLLTELYEPLMVGRAAFISFQTVAELHFGALRRGWGAPRLLQLHMKLARAQVVHSDDELVVTYAELRSACERSGHALAQREHDADRWIAATAIRLGVPLLSHDGIFRNAPRLVLENAGDD